MFGTKRLAKRSIVGTQVCASWHENGRYYPGTIQSTTEWPNGQVVYNVYFTEQRITKTFQDSELVGPGFKGIASTKLQKGQKVYITRNSRETVGMVVRHDNCEDEVVIDIGTQEDEPVLITRKLEDVRLMESRRSRRLQDQIDTDYSRLADFHLDSKRRAVSHSIDVPDGIARRRRQYSETSSSPDGIDDSEIMDETEAALVLTSLSCAASPSVGSSMGSSGVWCMKSTSPSPPSYSSSAPTTSGLLDEGIVIEESYVPESRKRRASRTVYKCLWPGCSTVFNTCPGIEKHIRKQHLGVRPDHNSDTSLSDHEEEFYYSEVEVSVDTVTQSLAAMYTSSPPPCDHDYQKKTHPISIPLQDHMAYFQPRESGSLPGSFLKTPLVPMGSWQNAKLPKVSRPSTSLNAKAISPQHKRSRSEVKKCRKVYGMENRDQWCTQCKWKKACTRFLD